MESDVKQHSDESYSDSDEEKDKSLYSVYKPAHIPGVYKPSFDAQTKEETALDNVDEDVQRNSTKVGGTESEDQSLQEGAVETKHSMSGTGIFGKSMVMVDTEDTEEPSLRGRKPPPVPPKPVMNKTPSQFQPEPSLHDTTPPSVPPRPAADKDNVHTDVDQSLEAPKPVPRRRKLQTGGEASQRGDALLPSEDLLSRETTPTPSPRLVRKRSSSSPEHQPTEEADSEILPKRKKDGTETLTDEDTKASNDIENHDDSDVFSDTLDFGPAESEKDQPKIADMEEKTFIIHSLSEKFEMPEGGRRKDISPAESEKDQTEIADIEEKTFIIHSLSEKFEMTEGDRSKDISDSLKTKDVTETVKMQKEDKYETETETEKENHFTVQNSNPDDEETKQYENNFQDSDSSKSDSDGDTSSNYGTPRSQSYAEDEEQEADIGQQTEEEKEDIKGRTSEEAPEKDMVTFGSKSLKTTLSSRLGDSFEIIESESGFECFDSLSKAASNNNYQSRTESDITSKRVSVKDMKSLFENVASGNSDKTSSAKKDKNDASFEVLPINKSATSYRTEVTQVETSLDGKDEDMSATSGKVDAPVTEDETNGARFQNVCDADSEEKANQNYEPNAVNLVADGTSDESRSDIPPPVEPKSLQVLESMKMMTMENDTPPAVPLKSLPPERDHHANPPISREGTQNPSEWANVTGPYSFQGGQEYLTSGHVNQAPRREEEMQYPGVQGASGQSMLYDYPSYDQYPFYAVSYQQHRQQEQAQAGQQSQQPQQYPPASHPYYFSYDQYGNPQYPYAYNSQMYPGGYYPTPDGRYFQQPVWYTPRSMQEQAQLYNTHASAQQAGQQFGTSVTEHETYQQSPQRKYEEIQTPNQQPERVLERHQRASHLPQTREVVAETADDGYTEISEVRERPVTMKVSRSEPSLEKKKAKVENTTHAAHRSKSEVARHLHSKQTGRQKKEPKKTVTHKKEEKKQGIVKQRDTKVMEEHPLETTEDHYLFFKGINPKQSKSDTLANFVEANCKCDEVNPGDIIFNVSRDCALVVCHGKPDLSKARERINSKGFEGYYPEVFEVDPPRCIAVSSEDEINNLEGLKLYFELPRSGGSEVVREPYEAEDGSCYVIEFEEHAVVKSVCEKGRRVPHKVDGKVLRVSPYYKCAGGEIWNTELHVIKIPGPVTVKLSKNCAVFLQRDCCKELRTSLEQIFCSVSFCDESLSLECRLHAKVDNFKNRLREWETKTQKIVDQYIQQNVTEEEVRVQGEYQQQVFSELCQYLEPEMDERIPEVVVSIKDISSTICLLGFQEPVKQLRSRVKTKEAEIEKRLRRTKETVSLDPFKIRLLDKVGKFEQLRRNLEDIELYIGDRDFTIEGDPTDITSVKIFLYEVHSNFQHFIWEHKFTRSCVDFIQRALVGTMNAVLKENGIFAEWEIDLKSVRGVWFTGEVEERIRDEENYYSSCRFDESEDGYEEIGMFGNTDVKHWFRKSLAEENIVIPDKVLASEEGVEFMADIAETHDRCAGIDLTDDGRKLLIFGMANEVQEIKRKVQIFLDEHVVIEDRMKCGTVEVKLLGRHMPERVKQIEAKLSMQKVVLRLQDEAATIWGTKEGITKAKEELQKVFGSIISRDHTIQRVAVKNVFRNEKANGTIDVVENHSKCVIQLPGEIETVLDRTCHPRQGYSAYPRPIESTVSGTGGLDEQKPRKRYYEAPNGVKIKLVKGEIGKQDGHVIVATTSPKLNLSSGAACKSVLMAGGQGLQDECTAKYPDGIKNGEIAVINGGNGLECNKVYLTSLPNWTAVEEKPRETLQKVMTTSLEMASKHQKMSILFCAMGTGQLKYPHDIVASEMFQSVIDFAVKHPGTTLKDVRFVLYQRDIATIRAFEEEEKIRLEGDGGRPVYDLQRGVIKIQVAVENIAEQKVDGIVCSVAGDLELNRKGACSALLRTGGPGLQTECKQKYPNGLEAGEVGDISGGNLPGKNVFLVVLPPHSPGAGDKLKKVMETCLSLAEAKGLRSLAFPALGAGHLRYPPEEVCRVMFECVSRWGVERTSTSVKTVRFIMHAKDRPLINTFKAFVKNAQGKGTRKDRNLLSHFMPGKASHAFSGQYNATDKDFQIKGIKLQVVQGDILEQKADAIICSVNGSFEFIGGVAQALVKKCPDVEKEAQKKVNKFKKDGLAVTKGHGLSAKIVIHVKFVESPSAWKYQMLKCLEKANKKGCKTVAFPLLGTGQGITSLNPAEIAAALFYAIDEFTHKHQKVSVKHVSLIVFQTQMYMMKPVLDSLHRSVQKAAEGKHSYSLTEKAKSAVKGVLDLGLCLVTGTKPGVMTKDEFDKMIEQTSSLQLKIYSFAKENIDACVKELNLKLEEQYAKLKIDDYKELIKSLTPEEEKELENMEILANTNIDKSSGIISIEGPVREAADIKSELQTRLLKIDRRRNEVKIAEDNYKLFRWYFEEITEVGIEHVEYEKVLNLRIEQAYKANENEVKFSTDKGEVFVIDLVNLVEYPKNDRTDTVKVLRKDILKQAGEALPQEWAPMKDGENLRRVNVPNTDKIYKDIEQRFLTEVKSGQYTGRIQFDKSKLQVSKIERIQNKTLYQQYVAKKRLIKEQKPNLPANMPIEKELWHGTTHDAVDSIEMHGFNRSYCGKHGTWYGAGVYFAKCASYSARGWLTGANPGTTGVKGYIFLSKVLTGQYCKGNPNMRYLPPVDPNKPTVLYDCAVDNDQNPMEFVIFHDTQAYPEYIVTFTA